MKDKSLRFVINLNKVLNLLAVHKKLNLFEYFIF